MSKPVLDYSGGKAPRPPISRAAVWGFITSAISPLLAAVVGQSLGALAGRDRSILEAPILIIAFWAGGIAVVVLGPIVLCGWGIFAARRRNRRGLFISIAGILLMCFYLFIFFAPMSPHR